MPDVPLHLARATATNLHGEFAEVVSTDRLLASAS